MVTSKVSILLMAAAAIALVAVGTAQAQLQHRYNFDLDLTDSVGSADGTATGDVLVAGGNVLVNLLDAARDGRVDLLANGANGININTYSATTIEFWATPNCDNVDACGPNPNDSFSTALGFGSVYEAGEGADAGAGADYILMQTDRGDDFSRGSIAVTDETQGAPWGAETGVTGVEYNDSAEHYYALVIDSSELTYYVDGAPAGTAALANPNAHGLANSLAGVSNDHVWIGSGYAIDQNWAGAMNELRIWNAAASDDYVAASYGAGADQLTDFIEKVAVPEPACLSLAALGLLSLVGLFRRSRG